jgi:GAF domain-containing protein
MAKLQGDVLDLAVDPVLQDITAQAAAVTRSRWSALCLELRRTLIVRAYHNLPRRLVGVMALDSTGSFCSDVVRSGKRFVVENVEEERRVRPGPQRQTNSRSYLGEPVSIDGVIVGALSVHDDSPRTFDDVELAALARLAGERLSNLASRRAPNRRLLDLALRPAFAEIRNDLTPLQAELLVAREALEVLATGASEERAKANHSIESLMAALADLQRSTRRLSENLDSLQLMCCGTNRAIVSEVVQASDELAYHHTHLVGGVRWIVNAPSALLDVSQRTSVSVLTASLSMLALQLGTTADRGGVDARVDRTDDHILVRLGANLDGGTLHDCATTVSDLVESTHIAIASAADAIQITLPAAA